MIRKPLLHHAVTGFVLAGALTTSARAGHDPDPVGPGDANEFSVRQGAAARSLTPAAAWYFKGQ